MSRPEWWYELAAVADETADRFSAAWYERFRVLHAERFPDADRRTRDNLAQMARSAALREAVTTPDRDGLFEVTA